MKQLTSLVALVLFPFVFYGQADSSQLFNESNFTLLGQGPDMANAGQLYAIRYRSTVDTSYTLKKVYSDSAFSQLLSRAFYKGNVLDGPFYGYALDTSRTQPLARFPGMLVEDALKVYPVDTITVRAYYKNGKLVGERLTSRGNNTAQQGNFTNGVKVGVWKDFNQQGQMRRKTTYNNRGRKISEETN
jgi:hypothetical protein